MIGKIVYLKQAIDGTDPRYVGVYGTVVDENSQAGTVEVSYSGMLDGLTLDEPVIVTMPAADLAIVNQI